MIIVPSEARVQAVSASADPLDEAVYLPWRHVLDNQIYVADVDAQLQSARADDGFQAAQLLNASSMAIRSSLLIEP